MSVAEFWIAFGGLITLIIVQIVVFAYRYGVLTERVTKMEETLKKGFTCPIHNQLSEELIRIDERTKERANIIAEITVAVAKARTEWDRAQAH